MAYSLSSGAAAPDEDLTGRRMLADEYATPSVKFLAQLHEMGSSAIPQERWHFYGAILPSRGT